MAALFQLSILTPERTVFEGEIEYVQAPGSEGYFGVLAHHAALGTALAEGELTVRHKGGKEDRWNVACRGLADAAATAIRAPSTTS